MLVLRSGFLKIRKMTGRIIILTILTAVLSIIIGCSAQSPKAADIEAQSPPPPPVQSAPRETATEVEIETEIEDLSPENIEPIPPESIPVEAAPAEPIPPKPIPPEPNLPEPKPVESARVDPVDLIAESPELTPPAPPPAEPNEPEAEPNEPKAEPNEPTRNSRRQDSPAPEPATHDAATAFHNKFSALFATYVNEEGLVNYKTLKRNRFELKDLMDQLAGLEAAQYNSWPNEDKIALWINAYNLQMINIILQNYPIESSRFKRLWFPPTSIRHIDNIWTDYKFIVMDEEFTLAEVEKRFFGTDFTEPRVFLALCRASVSSPPLRNEPYTGQKLYDQLDDQAKKFLSSPLAFKIDRDQKIVHLSALFEPAWHGKDFIAKYWTEKKFKGRDPAVRAVLNFATGYISEEDVKFLELENYTVKFINYDWRLNQ